MRKKTWDDFTRYLREQWTGFPPEMQRLGSRVVGMENRYVKPRAGRYMSGVMENGKQRAGELRYVGRFLVKKPKDPNKVRVSNKQFLVDIVLSKKEQEQIKAIPKYFDEENAAPKKTNLPQNSAKPKRNKKLGEM